MAKQAYQSTEISSFLLGLNVRPLPLEPAPLNREYYNFGLEASELNEYIQLQNLQILQVMAEDTKRNIPKSVNKKYIEEEKQKMVEAYNKIIKIKENHPELSSQLETTVDSAVLTIGELDPKLMPDYARIKGKITRKVKRRMARLFR